MRDRQDERALSPSSDEGVCYLVGESCLGRQALLDTRDLAPQISRQVHDHTGSKTGLQQVSNCATPPGLGSSRKVLHGCACGHRCPED